jgi:hypothetical protein
MQNEDRHEPVGPFSAWPRTAKPDASDPSPPEDFLRMMKWIRQAQSDAERQESAENDSADLED